MWNAVYDAHNQVAGLKLGSMTSELHRQFENSSPYEILQELKSMFEKQAGVERFDLIHTFLLANKKRETQFVRNYNMHNMGKTIGELHALLIEYEKGKPVLQPHRNQSVVRQPTAFKSVRPRISKPRFASQVDVNKDLPKPVTSHYFPKERESAFAKPHHVIVSSNFRNSLKNMPRFSSNDMVHNQYLAEAKNKTQDVAMTSDHNSSELGIHDHSNELSSSKLVPKVVPPADKTSTS
ncbi:hypothetical protein Tco_0421298 [Tanacetum coccineum]